MKICGRKKRNHVSDENDLEDQPAAAPKKRCRPCRFCCGFTTKTWAFILGVFDIVSGILGLLAVTAITVVGDLKTHFYPLEKFNLPREYLFSTMFILFYNIMCGTLLLLAMTCKDTGGLYAWICLNVPLLVSPLKIGEMVIVSRLTKEIREEEKAMEYYYDKLESGKETMRKKLIISPVNIIF